LIALAGSIGVDFPVNLLTGQGNANVPASSRLIGLIAQCDAARGSGTFDGRWNRFAGLVYAWDAAIQDFLARGIFGRASGYQLGRGLAEMSWVLDPASDSGAWTSWSYLFGDDRIGYVQQLLDRLAPFFESTLTLPCMKDSLEAWRRQGQHESSKARAERQNSNAPQVLRQQVQHWRDLIVTGQDPRYPASPGTRIRRRSPFLLWLSIRTLWFQLLLGVLGAAALALGAFLLPSHNGQGGVLAILGAVGITSSSLSAKAKSTTTQLGNRLHSAFNTALAVQASTILPRERRDSQAVAQQLGSWWSKILNG
jgi:hypothetical protein